MIFFGIDISKLTFDVTAVFEKKYKHLKFKNNEQGFNDLVKWIKSYKLDCYICMEASGIYGMCLAQHLVHNKFKTIVSNPYKIKSFGQMNMSRNKTDKADSLCIAKYCKHLYQDGKIKNNLYVPKSKCYQKLQSLVTRLEQVNLLRSQELNHKESTLDKLSASFVRKTIIQLQNQIKAIKKAIKKCINSDETLKEQFDLLVSIPGIGDKTAWAILAYLGDISLFSCSSQVVSYVGINPHVSESGTSLKSARLSKMGNKRLRKALYLPAVVAKKYNPVMIEFYGKLLGKGKPKKVAICAVMRRLLVICYGVLKSQQKFDLNYRR